MLSSSAMHAAFPSRWMIGGFLSATITLVGPATAQEAPSLAAAQEASPPAGASDAPPAAAQEAPPQGFEPAVQYAPPPMFVASPPPRPGPRRNPALAVTGIVSASLGLVALGVGGVMFSASDAQQCVIGGTSELDLRTPEGCTRDEDMRAASVGLLIGGGAAIAVGVPLIIIGARRGPPTAPTTGLRIGPGNATLFGRF